MIPHLLALAAIGMIAGLILNVLTKWLPFQIDQEEKFWIAEVSGADTHPVEIGLFRFIRDFQWEKKSTLTFCLASIFIFVGVPLLFGMSFKSLSIILFVWVMVALAMIDYRTKLLPDVLILPMVWVGLLVQMQPDMQTIGIKDSIFGAVFGYLLLWFVAHLFLMTRKQEGLGRGDMKLMALIGAWMGPMAIPIVLLMSAVMGGIWQSLAVLRSKAGWKDNFPFGPWIIISALIYLLRFAI